MQQTSAIRSRRKMQNHQTQSVLFKSKLKYPRTLKVCNFDALRKTNYAHGMDERI